MRLNVKGLSKAKADNFGRILDEEMIDTLVVQETRTHDQDQLTKEEQSQVTLSLARHFTIKTEFRNITFLRFIYDSMCIAFFYTFNTETTKSTIRAQLNAVYRNNTFSAHRHIGELGRL